MYYIHYININKVSQQPFFGHFKETTLFFFLPCVPLKLIIVEYAEDAVQSKQTHTLLIRGPEILKL